jgi:diguanylate cyclase (GGDEF)-like protein
LQYYILLRHCAVYDGERSRLFRRYAFFDRSREGLHDEHRRLSADKDQFAGAGAKQMSTKLIKTILLVEDNAGDARLIREMLNEQGSRDTELTHVDCMSAAEKHLAEHAVDIILLDLGLPDAQGLEAIRRAHAAAPGVPLVVLTGLDDESLAVQALQQGAQDYLINGQIETRGLLRVLRYAIERKTMERAALAMSRQMAHSAEHDFLTGLPNRMLLNDRVGQAIALATRHMKKVAVLFLDLDGFKHINDSLGHPIGDKLLQSIAKRLVDSIRGSDSVSRQGGDEFVVLLLDLDQAEDAVVTARRLLQAVAQPHSIDQHDLHVTASIGVSVYPDDGLDADTLIKNADTAMYQAKENGRRSFQFFKPAMNVRAVERQFIEEGLQRALERQEFVLHYQPKVNLMTGAITGAEALIRWTHPTRGPISPAQFIPVAEDCGLILPIGAWVLREACEQARAWTDAGLPVTSVAVNVSAMQFRDKNFLDHLFVILGKTGLDPSSLELELTESVLMKHAASTTTILQTLRESGIRVAVDDFGTGYSSLSYLRKFSVDAVKIDQSFVRQISVAGEDTTIVKAVIGMARGLKLRVIAEGVETLEELVFLRAYRCDEAQGYYFSRPVLPQQFALLLRNGIPESSIVA